MNMMRHQDLIRSMREGSGLIGFGTEQSAQACSYDLRVGTVIKAGTVIREADTNSGSVEVLPGEIVTIITLEELTLSAKIAGLAFAMNKWSSQGLLVLNPGHIDPGFSGPLSVKALNLRKTSITLRFRDPIFTILFLELTGDTDAPYPGHAKKRQDYERDFEERDREITPTSIADLLRETKGLPFVTEDQLATKMWSHGSTILNFLITLLAVVLAIIALRK